MEEENYLNPRAKRSGIIGAASATKKGGGGSSKTLVYILLAVVLLSVAFLIFGLVVLRIKAPTLRLSNVVVKGLSRNSSSLNMTMTADFRLYNMNFGRFDFNAGKTTLYYGNATIGEAGISGGRVGGRKTRGIDATVDVMMMSSGSSNMSRDIELNLVRVVSLAELRGELRVMKIVNRRRTSVMNCSMDINLTTQKIQDLSCR